MLQVQNSNEEVQEPVLINTWSKHVDPDETARNDNSKLSLKGIVHFGNTGMKELKMFSFQL